MQGKINVMYQLICDNDMYKEISIKEILENEKIIKLLKSEFAKGVRNLQLSASDLKETIIISSQKKLYSFEVKKQDFADLIELAEEDAKKRNLLKKGCQAIEIVDFKTLD